MQYYDIANRDIIYNCTKGNKNLISWIYKYIERITQKFDSRG